MELHSLFTTLPHATYFTFIVKAICNRILGQIKQAKAQLYTYKSRSLLTKTPSRRLYPVLPSTHPLEALALILRLSGFTRDSEMSQLVSRVSSSDVWTYERTAAGKLAVCEQRTREKPQNTNFTLFSPCILIQLAVL